MTKIVRHFPCEYVFAGAASDLEALGCDACMLHSTSNAAGAGHGLHKRSLAPDRGRGSVPKSKAVGGGKPWARGVGRVQNSPLAAGGANRQITGCVAAALSRARDGCDSALSSGPQRLGSGTWRLPSKIFWRLSSAQLQYFRDAGLIEFSIFWTCPDFAYRFMLLAWFTARAA